MEQVWVGRMDREVAQVAFKRLYESNRVRYARDPVSGKRLGLEWRGVEVPKFPERVPAGGYGVESQPVFDTQDVLTTTQRNIQPDPDYDAANPAGEAADEAAGKLELDPDITHLRKTNASSEISQQVATQREAERKAYREIANLRARIRRNNDLAAAATKMQQDAGLPQPELDAEIQQIGAELKQQHVAAVKKFRELRSRGNVLKGELAGQLGDNTARKRAEAKLAAKGRLANGDQLPPIDAPLDQVRMSNEYGNFLANVATDMLIASDVPLLDSSEMSTTDQLINAMRTGRTTVPQLDEVAKRYGLKDTVELFERFRQFGSAAGRDLNIFARQQREINKLRGLSPELDDWINSRPPTMQEIDAIANGPSIALGAKGWNNTQPTRSVSVINRTGYRFISADASATLPTWTVNGTYSNVYQSSAISAANGRSVTDMSRSDYVTYTDKNGALQTLTNQPKRYRTLKRVTSTALVAAEAGTYFHDGTYLQVRPHDDRVLTGTTTMLATSDSNNGRMPAVSSATIYAENIDFVGGFRAFLALHADTVTGHTLAFNGCSFQGAGSSNGLSVEAACAVRLYRCGAYDNFTDGFNYHAAGNDAVTEADAPTVIEVECIAIGNGATGSSGTSDNASTAHEYTEVITLGCVYVNSDDSVVADINNAHRWMMSCHVGAALTTGSGRQNIKAANSANIWLDDTYAAPGTNDRWLAETATTSVIRHSGSGSVVNGSGGAGVVRAYLG
jgi:hypothetical protein